LRGLAPDALILPNALVPAFNKTPPLTTTSWSICTSKVLPTGSLEEMELTVRTPSVVPAGIVAAFKDETAEQAQATATIAMNFSLIILG